MQRPLRSQSPKRVGSGPQGPPISREAGGGTGGARGAAVSVQDTGSQEGAEGGAEVFFVVFCIF
jgi:hypothetical protein